MLFVYRRHFVEGQNAAVVWGATQTDCSNQRTFSKLDQQRLSILDEEGWIRSFVCLGEIRSANFCPSLTCDNPSTWFLGQPSTVIRQNIKPSLWHFQTVTAHQKHSSTTIT